MPANGEPLDSTDPVGHTSDEDTHLDLGMWAVRMPSEARLGLWLAAYRRSVRLEDLGLAPNGDGRPNGPTQRDIASLAGITVRTYNDIEARGHVPSTATLAALVTALRLNPDQTDHLYRLAKIRPPAQLATGEGQRLSSATDHIQALLDCLQTPAIGYTNDGTVLGTNHPFATSFPDVADQPNLLIWLFTNPQAQTALPDWDFIIRQAIARLRVVHAAAADPTPINDIITAITDHNPDVQTMWNEQTDVTSDPPVAVHRIRDARGTIHPITVATVVAAGDAGLGPRIAVFLPSPTRTPDQRIDLQRRTGDADRGERPEAPT